MRTKSVAQDITRLGLSTFMVVAGTSHLTFAREEFSAQVPTWMPLDEDFVILASGVVEIGLGLSFAAFPKHRKLIGLALAGFYVAIFPGNINQYVEQIDAFGLDTDTKRLVRLFFQPVLVAGALYGGGLLGRKNKGKTTETD